MTAFPNPSNHSIHVGGEHTYYFELEAATASAILPGDLVQFNNPPGDCTVKEGQADSDTIIGVADLSPQGAVTPPRGGDRLTAYAAEDRVKLIRGPIAVMLRIASSEEIQCGEFVQPAASGEVKAYECGTDNDCQRIAQSMETIDQDTENFSWGFFLLERFG